MTDAELKEWAERWVFLPWYGMTTERLRALSKAYLAILAREAALVAELRDIDVLADQWATSNGFVVGSAKGVLLHLFAVEAARGEVAAACPVCQSLTGLDVPIAPTVRWQCRDCGHVFLEPVYYQRISQPAKEPA